MIVRSSDSFKCDNCSLPCRGRLQSVCIKTILTSLKSDLKMALMAILVVLIVALLSVTL